MPRPLPNHGNKCPLFVQASMPHRADKHELASAARTDNADVHALSALLRTQDLGRILDRQHRLARLCP